MKKTNSRRYSPKLMEDAEKRLEELLKLGNKYHKAAKQVSRELGIDFLTLRWKAYSLAQKMGVDIGKIQHREWTDHVGL